MVAKPKTEALAVYVSPAMLAALAEAAARRETEPAEYLRQAGIDRMKADGITIDARPTA